MPTIKRRKKKISTKYKHESSIDFAKYYNSKAWKHLRSSYILHHPLCEECLKNGIVTAAEHVHHIKEFSKGITEDERWQLLLDASNLQSLCIECHNKKHKHKFTKVNVNRN